MIIRIAILAAFSLALGALDPQATRPAPNKPHEVFEHAQELMDLRTYGATPFHLKVSFHAFPGTELLAPGEISHIITGNGSYEEIWVEPHHWSRQVDFGDFHAVEEESGRSRKMKASSDYVPLRVIMLMEALLFPIPRELTSGPPSDTKGWHMDQVASESISLTRLTKTIEAPHVNFTDSFYFFPSGMLALRNNVGLVTLTEGTAVYAGKLVPKHLSIRAGEHELLTAELSIEGAQLTSRPIELPGDPAPAGMTLRPFHASEVRPPGLPILPSGVSPSYSTPAFSYQALLDRQGRYREVELLIAPNLSVGAASLSALREDHVHPAEIDGSPCQLLQIRKVD